MKRVVGAGVGIVLGAFVGLTLVAALGHTEPEPHPYGPPIGPEMPRDTGTGEMLVVVVGGVFETRAEAEAANAEMGFGDVAGYYVVPVAQFQGFEGQVGTPGDFALVSAFRTDEGAREFAELAGSFGYPATILANRVRSLGGVYAGLGQEASPDGSGPLTAPVPESLP